MRESKTKGTKNIKSKNRKHNKKMLRVLVLTGLGIFMLSFVALIAFGIYYICTSSKFDIAKVQVSGNTYYDTQTLIDTANVSFGENLLRYSKKDIINNLEQLPYIEDVVISKKLPNLVKIKVKEYASNYIAYNNEQDKYIRLTKDGIILEETEGEEKTESELILFGISFDDEIVAKSKVADTELQKIRNYEEIYKIYNISGIQKQITSVEFKENNVILTLDYDLNVIMDNIKIDYDINFLKSILVELAGKTGSIDMTKSNPIFTESLR